MEPFGCNFMLKLTQWLKKNNTDIQCKDLRHYLIWNIFLIAKKWFKLSVLNKL